MRLDETNIQELQDEIKRLKRQLQAADSGVELTVKFVCYLVLGFVLLNILFGVIL